MELEAQDFHFWKLVLSVSDSIAGNTEQGKVTKDELVTFLGTIEEVIGNPLTLWPISKNMFCWSYVDPCESRLLSCD